ncbi:DUF3368 domain-containing protein [Altericista sp. CCNU0014]|uniref:DUF3368 domain-containing protein n=1 Tax=Altericista sp. CCNU0014 TaxID=3082949 RepID=UPI00384EA3FC
MPEVIADTSPIQYLYQTNLLDLLQSLYGRILIPQAVVEELSQGCKQGVVLPDPELISWIEIRKVSTSNLIPMVPNLGLGEREVISLAISLSDSLVILDDALARNYALQMNVALTGTLGVLLKAKQSGYINQISPIVEQLDTLRFRLAPATRTAILKLANEA